MTAPVTPEQLVLAAIVRSMKPKQYARLVALIGDIEADNVVRLRQPVTTAERNEVVSAARDIAGVR
jgi:hypothetical protein